MLELACKEAVFHFNKHHLVDPETPMWVVKTKGKTYYVDHVSSSIPWSTKETPDNHHTKGAIKVKDVLITIGDDNCAEFKTLTSTDLARLRAKDKGYTRIMFRGGFRTKLVEFIEQNGIGFTPFKYIPGSCGSGFYLCDIMDRDDVVLMNLSLQQGLFRVLQENETYYKAYDDPSLLDRLDADSIDDDYEEEDFYEDEDED